MGLSFNIYRQQLLEVVSIYDTLDEIFDTKPFKTEFSFSKDNTGSVEVAPFRDLKYNEIAIFFYHEGNDLYTLDFTVNQSSFKATNTKYTLVDYSTLLSTVAQVTSQFLEKYSPLGLRITGTNVWNKIKYNSQAEGQKNRIYTFFLSQVDDKGEYMVDKSVQGTIALMRK